MTGHGFEFKVNADGGLRCYQKDGVNVGTSGLLRHYPDHDLTLAILGVGEDAVWAPVADFDAAVPDRVSASVDRTRIRPRTDLPQ